MVLSQAIRQSIFVRHLTRASCPYQAALRVGRNFRVDRYLSAESVLLINARD